MEQDKNKEIEEIKTDDAEFEERPAGNKDLWLFLIVLDVIVLCVFGFFIYKYFSAQVFEVKPDVQTETTVEEEPAELVVIEKEEVIAPKPEPAVQKAEPVLPTSASPKAEVPQAAPAVQVETAPEVAQAPQEISAPVAQETDWKESISIAYGKGKYHPVTFRWFGEGKKVAIVSGFTSSKPRALKKKDDHWEITLSIAPGTYKFLYVIDGKNTLDPYAPAQDGRSIVEVK